MRKPKTRFDALKETLSGINSALSDLEREKDMKTNELETYVRRHRSLKFDNLKTCDVDKLENIYKYFDDRYPIEWQGGLRCDNRGMRLNYWLDDDPDYLILHITSDHDNLFFSGSTSWLVKAVTLEDKVNIIKKIKSDMLKILK